MQFYQNMKKAIIEARFMIALVLAFFGPMISFGAAGDFAHRSTPSDQELVDIHWQAVHKAVEAGARRYILIDPNLGRMDGGQIMSTNEMEEYYL